MDLLFGNLDDSGGDHDAGIVRGKGKNDSVQLSALTGNQCETRGEIGPQTGSRDPQVVLSWGYIQEVKLAIGAGDGGGIGKTLANQCNQGTRNKTLMVINDAAGNAAVRPVIRNLWLPRCAARRAGRRGLLLSKEAKRAQQKCETKQARAGLTGSVPVEHMREDSGNHGFWTEILCISVTPGHDFSHALKAQKRVSFRVCVRTSALSPVEPALSLSNGDV
jgi:hypothetical protein